MFPINNVRTTIHQITSVQWPAIPAKQVENNRKKAAKAAVFTTVAMYVVMVVGAPSYTSGAQKWKGANDDLKLNPTNNNKTPAIARPVSPLVDKCCCIVIKSKEPVTPYIR